MERQKNVEGWTCSPGSTLREVMTRFNTLPQPFVIVVDDRGRPLGTVTDGDIRRAVLAECSLDASVAEVMNRAPMIGSLAAPEQARENLQELKFVPMVDDAGFLREVWLSIGHRSRITTALVMAGGFGRRLGARTDDTPKPLLPVGGKPILEHILEWLEKAGIEDIHISAHYLADKIERFASRWNGKSRPRVIRERTSLGTAGSLAALPSSVEGSVLVVNGDVLTNADLHAFESFHIAHGHDATVAVSPYQVSVPYGVIRQDDNGVFERIDEKPSYTHFVASGIYLMETEFCRLVPPDTRIDMPELLALGQEAELTVGLFPIHEYWIDVGQPDDLQAADRDLRDAK
ncbi:MAG: sugar phosphate nucleotidyltransferase [Alphaproteobacteria bacterium]|nr:sugar phosphate nucleotidyltransferase [Alphaproteobacteria bacterium]